MKIKYVNYPIPEIPDDEGSFYPDKNEIHVKHGLSKNRHNYVLFHEKIHYLIHCLYIPYRWQSQLDYIWDILEVTFKVPLKSKIRGYKYVSNYYNTKVFTYKEN